MRWLGLLLIVCATFGARNAPAARQPEAPVDGQRIDAIFTDIVGVRPGYAIGIVQDGELVFARGYGFADIAARTPIDAETAFNLASLSKQFTGAAVAREIIAGRLSLDAPLRRRWPELPAYMEPVTIGHLVYMTSGIPEYYTLPSPRGGWSSENRFTVDDSIRAVSAAPALSFQPGERWAYSNINYQLLAVLAGRAGGAGFASLMTRHFFEPLGMSRTWVDADLRRIDGMATAYVPAEEGAGWRRAPRLSPHYGGSGMFSTLRDLARWDAALYRDHRFGRAFTDLMLSTRAYRHPKQNDAFGLVHGAHRGAPMIWYEGGDYGVSTFMARLPERRTTVICLANFAEANCAARTRQVLDLLPEREGLPARQ